MSLLAPDRAPPHEGTFPDLSAAKVIGLDVETFDPHLKKRGPGDIRGDGQLVGIAVGADEERWYLPMRHEGGGNMDADRVLEWARDNLTRPNQTKVGANIMYDIAWLATDDVYVAGPFRDVQFAAALLDETADSYALNDIALRYLGEEKRNEYLFKLLEERYGGKDQGGRIHLASGTEVEVYGKGDVDLPLRLLPVLEKLLDAERLNTVWDLECRLIPMLVAMRRQGVKIGHTRLDQIRADMLVRYELAVDRLEHVAGRRVDPWSGDSLAKAFDAENIAYPMTPKTKKPSFQKAWLEHHPSELAAHVLEARKWSKAVSTFIDGLLVNHLINGRVHPSIHPLRRVDEEGKRGAVSGRFSYTQPNLQFVPERDEEMRALIRAAFEPEDGRSWVKQDLSQIEYRYLVHYAVLMKIGPLWPRQAAEGAQLAAARYRADPKTDYHKMVQYLIKKAVNVELGRRPTKIINFGLIYGMGKYKLRGQIGLSEEEGGELFAAYHEAIPYARAIMKVASNRAERRGYVTTILGRRARFNEWESRDWDQAQIEGRMTLEQARKRYGHRIRRARLHKAFNAVDQGSAADHMKQAMVDIWESGVCAVLGAPLVTVHDELDWQADLTDSAHYEAIQEAKHCMETAIPLEIPVISDQETGPSWGELK